MVDLAKANLRIGSGLSHVLEHALELARESISDQLKDLDSDGGGAQHRARRKDSIVVGLQRVLPGSAPGLDAMLAADGKVTASPEKVV